MKKKRSKTLYKKDAWNAFSVYIRTRDTEERWPEGRVGKCCTCKKEYEFKKLQAGHFIPGRSGSVLLDERIVHAQCYHCNVGLKGNPREYDKFMRTKYTDEEVSELDNLAYQTKIYSIPDYIDATALFKQKTKELLDNVAT